MSNNFCQLSGFDQVTRTLTWKTGLILRPESRALAVPVASPDNCGTSTLLSLGRERATNEGDRRTNSRFQGRTTSAPCIVNRIFPFAYYHGSNWLTHLVVVLRSGSYQKRRGRILFRDPAPSIRFLKIRFGHRITTLPSQNSLRPTNFAVLSVFCSRIRCKSFVSAPFVAVQLPVGAASLVADSPGGRSPLSSWKIALPLS
jgi:hypothetical protein